MIDFDGIEKKRSRRGVEGRQPDGPANIDRNVIEGANIHGLLIYHLHHDVLTMLLHPLISY
jgi:hypothetical protein